MQHTFVPKGVCSKKIEFTLDDNNIVTDLKFTGGCAGNALGIAALSKGRSAEELSEILKEIRCGFKSTSCPAQLSIALAEAVGKK